MSHFFAILARMKFIRRWGLMRNTQEENIQEHTLQTAMIAYHLCVMHNTYSVDEPVNASFAAVLAMYHDVSEVYTGDLPTPVKYFSPDMRKTYGIVETLAQKRILESLPAELQGIYEPLIVDGETQREWPFVKAADTISAYLKCQQEMNAGNHEFAEAYTTTKKRLDENPLPEVKRFMEEYVPSFLLTVDEVNRK